MVAALRVAESASDACRSAGAVRTNLTITEADGITTKLNEPGAALDARRSTHSPAPCSTHAKGASWVVLSGSLPPGDPTRLVRRSGRQAGVIAVPGRRRHLRSVRSTPGRWAAEAAPDLIKPNAEELAGLVGASPEELEVLPPRVIRAVVSAANLMIARGAKPSSSPSAPQGPYSSTPPAAGWPPRHRSRPQHRRRRRLVAGGLRAGRGRWRRAAGVGCTPPSPTGRAQRSLPGSAVPRRPIPGRSARRSHGSARLHPHPTRP